MPRRKYKPPVEKSIRYAKSNNFPHILFYFFPLLNVDTAILRRLLVKQSSFRHQPITQRHIQTHPHLPRKHLFGIVAQHRRHGTCIVNGRSVGTGMVAEAHQR
jgi:hypothetical protein